ncbi:MAG: hypothetical protein A2X93_04830 [Deltaproteobacteria bacterium GWC2_56_8]|nr:MAG: hypothetical protein A2X99_10075 [Deltaproteobacteria bacterium GWB2_55_19]OGP36844.1 MAG: hypothetical protein A2X93_04830 [Deltaproteobacteria bacterium GWC2_56_8]
MKREYKLYIRDIHDSIVKIDEFVAGMNYDKFSKDTKTSDAVVRRLEIIGEASKNVPRDVKLKYKTIPWADMSKMRDKIAHDYFGINLMIVWKVIREELPGLQSGIAEILRQMKEKV